MHSVNNYLSNLANLLLNLEVRDPAVTRQFVLGERMEAQVMSREGDNYLVQAGARLFRAESTLSLPVGAELILVVAEQKDGRTYLKLEQALKHDSSEQEQGQDRVRRLAAKYGVTGEKEISQLAEQLAKLPVEEMTGVRWLLDPHLAAGVIIIPYKGSDPEARIEIGQYKQAAGQERVWEVSFDLELARLGLLEIVIKLLNGRIYTRIWAEKPETEALLKARQDELDLLDAQVEIVAVNAGPIIARDTRESIDLKI